MNYGPCDLCEGTGKILGKKECPVCLGFGVWEFVADDNEAALRFLKDPDADVSDFAKKICGERIHSLPPDHYEAMLRVLDHPQETLDELHMAGARKWGWAWTHANRFAIALCKLNGGDPTQHSYGLAKMAWSWLEKEKQGLVEAPWLDEKYSEKS